MAIYEINQYKTNISLKEDRKYSCLPFIHGIDMVIFQYYSI